MRWDQLASEQGGVITRGQLRSCGLTRHVIDRLIRSGQLKSGPPGVLTVRAAPYTVSRRVWMAILATRGVVGFATAGSLWRVLDAEVGTVDVIVDPRRRVIAPPGVRVHRVAVPPREMCRLQGIPVTSRSWTVTDLLATSSREDAVRLADRALQRRWITARDLERRLVEYPGRTGNPMLRLVLARTADGAAAHSERILHHLLRTAGVFGWLANHPVRVDGATVAVVDVAFPQAQLAIEVDGFAFHSDVDRFQRDRQRHNVLVALGWTVLRFTWADLTQRPDYVVSTVCGQLRMAG